MKLKILAVELKPEDHKRLKEKCKDMQMSMTVFVREMIKKFLEGEKRNE